MAKVAYTRKLSLIALFTALAYILNVAISIPAPYADFLIYEVWEVPILLSLLLLDFTAGAAVAFLNMMVLEVVKPGPLPTGPVYNFLAIISMFAGVLAAERLSSGRGRVAAVGLATLLGGASRTLVMTVVNALVLPQPYPVGFSIPVAALPALLALIGVFNFTTAVYTVPLAYTVKEAVVSRTRAAGWLKPAKLQA
jgi:riboflavin transporter FmnP